MTTTQYVPGLDGVKLSDLVKPERYADGYPHDVFAALRQHSPVHWCEIKGFAPFWAITRHADIKFVSTHPEVFSSASRLVLGPEADAALGAGSLPMTTVINTDPPLHREYRNMVGPYFRPKTLRDLEDRVREVSNALLDEYAGHGEAVELDFATDIASWHPLKMIAEALGIAEQDEPTVLRIANEVFGAMDPEFARDRVELFTEALTFLTKLVSEKRGCPRDDITSVLAQATLNGEPVDDFAVIGYLMILITAGHDTTRHSLTGGISALIDHPEQLELLRERPELCAYAADEIVRWTTPVTQFMRTATQDCELSGTTIKAGESVCLFYASGNRDEEVFDQPFRFQVDRTPNPHLGWGIGEHYCLGANLAKMEIRVMLEELVPRLESIEMAGPKQGLHGYFVSGIKHLPIRWRLRPAL